MKFRISMCATAFAAVFATTATLPGIATAQQRFITLGTGGDGAPAALRARVRRTAMAAIRRTSNIRCDR